MQSIYHVLHFPYDVSEREIPRRFAFLGMTGIALLFYYHLWNTNCHSECSAVSAQAGRNLLYVDLGFGIWDLGF